MSALFAIRRQFDSNSCCIWLVAGIASYVLNLPIPSQKQEGFEIAYSLVKHVHVYEYVVEPETIPVAKKYSSAEFLINVLLKEPQKSKYF